MDDHINLLFNYIKAKKNLNREFIKTSEHEVKWTV